jgi:hypothetical protein
MALPEPDEISSNPPSDQRDPILAPVTEAPANDPELESGDVNHDGVVDASDIALIISAWGPCPPQGECAADVDLNGMVNLIDLMHVVGNWR